MNKREWTFRTPAGRQLAALACGLVSFGLAAGTLVAQSLHPTVQDGRVIWTNDGPTQAGEAMEARAANTAPPAARAVSKAELVYWSNVEQRWKPVRTASPKTLRTAKQAAGEVNSEIAGLPKTLPKALQKTSPKTFPKTSSIVLTKPAPGKPAKQPFVSTTLSASGGSADIDRYIVEAAARHHVDANLVRALVKVESNYNPGAVSRKGAMGLMQLMPATAKLYDLHNPFDPAQNVEAGVRHLKGLLENFGGDVSLSLAAYNAGQGAVERSGGIPPYAETRNYVKRITSLMGNHEVRVSGLAMPIHVSRDERGHLVISNWE